MSHNRARDRGDRFERLCRLALSNQGWLVVRSAGSLGCADLVAFRADHQPWFISCKATQNPYLRPAEWLRLYNTAISVNAVPVLAYKNGLGVNGIEYLALMGPHKGGPKKLAVARLDST